MWIISAILEGEVITVEAGKICGSAGRASLILF
jgi:hypothetical protein